MKNLNRLTLFKIVAISKDALVGDLYRILTSSIANTRFFNARSKGFRAEIEYTKKIKAEGVEYLDAGQFVVSGIEQDKTPENYFFYMTITNDAKDRYKDFYKLLSRLTEIKKMFFIEVEDASNWGTQKITIKDTANRGRIPVDILKPSFTVYNFENNAWNPSDFDAIKKLLVASSVDRIAKNKENHLSYLLGYDLDEIINVYCNRYVLDVELGGHNKGMMDFDLIIVEDEKFVAVETKEKDPIGKQDHPNDQNQWAFGWDSRRIGWYMHLNIELGLKTRYVIREVNNQQERKFLKWKKIDLDRFRLCASWLSERAGGGGGGTISASYSAFDNV